MTGITVKELAERICRPNEEMAAVIERLRNWTQEGLLETAGEKNPGTGRRRHYDENAVVDALVLTTLADIGIPSVRASQLKYDRKDLLSHGRAAFSMAMQNPALPVYLVIRRTYEGTGRGHRYVTTIYIQQVERTKIGLSPNQGVLVPDDAETTIVLNVTAILKRLNIPAGE